MSCSYLFGIYFSSLCIKYLLFKLLISSFISFFSNSKILNLGYYFLISGIIYQLHAKYLKLIKS